jgi:hypothetical protein
VKISNVSSGRILVPKFMEFVCYSLIELECDDF